MQPLSGAPALRLELHPADEEIPAIAHVRADRALDRRRQRVRRAGQQFGDGQLMGPFGRTVGAALIASLFPPRKTEGPFEARWMQGSWSPDPISATENPEGASG